MQSDRDVQQAGSALAFAERAGNRGGQLPLVISLHPRGGDAASGLALATQIFGDDPDIVAPQAARPCNPFQSNLATAGYAGFSWYLGDKIAEPEPASFGDVLEQLDRLLNEHGRTCVLLGVGQGAVLAITMALYRPKGLVGVYAVNGLLAQISGWDRPMENWGGIEFVLTETLPDQASALNEAIAVRGGRCASTTGLPPSEATNWLKSRAVTSRKKQDG